MVWNVTKLAGLGRFELQLNPSQMKHVQALAKTYKVRQEDIVAHYLYIGVLHINPHTQHELVRRELDGNMEKRLRDDGDYR